MINPAINYTIERGFARRKASTTIVDR